jgi:hypothetical protein
MPNKLIYNLLVVGHQPLDRLVVGIENELRAINIGPEMYDSPYNNKTFPFV